jgi:protein-S-isoprenylcysteine O-methyltransferase Ste14
MGGFPHPFRRKNLSPRLLPVYALAAAALLLARPSGWGVLVGTLGVAAGAALRVWGAGHLVKNDRLTVSGPYAHLRHPLYAGSLLLGAGFAALAGGPVLLFVLVPFTALYFAYYLPYKDRVESARLERRYGADYACYWSEVPALLPSLAAWQPPPGLAAEARRRWSRDCFTANSEHGTLIGIALALLVLALRPALLP